MVELRKETETLFADLAERIKAHIVLAEDPAVYRTMAIEINTLVKTYQDAIALRHREEKPDEVLDEDYKEPQLTE